MRRMAITLVLGSVATLPTTSFLPTTYDTIQTTIKREAEWLPTFADGDGANRYVTAPVKSEEIVKTVMATGTLVPALNVEVGSVLSGQVSKLLVDFNDKVVKGQVLAELDDQSYALAVDAARAALEGAAFEIEELRSAAQPSGSRPMANGAPAPSFTKRAWRLRGSRSRRRSATSIASNGCSSGMLRRSLMCRPCSPGEMRRTPRCMRWKRTSPTRQDLSWRPRPMSNERAPNSPMRKP